jgi:hypothetical protein
VVLIDGHANTSVMTLIRLSDPNPETSLFARREGELVGFMDRWLDRLSADASPGTALERMARDKPDGLTEGCWATDGTRLVQPLSYHGNGRCEALYPTYGNPRMAAGGPLTDDVLKCSLKPVAVSDYAQPLSPGQLARLKSIFAAGVCDYSRPGQGQDVEPATWVSY